MLTGVVKSVKQRDGQKYGFFVTASREQVFFHAAEGREFETRSTQLFFQPETRPVEIPKPKDLVVFDLVKTPRGLRASPWGLYTSFRQTYDWLLDPYLPPQAVEFPFLLDVIIAARRLYDPGEFTLRTQPLTSALWRTAPVDDLTRFKATYFYLVERQANSLWLVQELKSKLLVKSPGKTPNVRNLRRQLADLGVRLQRFERMLVRLEVDECLSLIPKSQSGTNVEKRELTVFL